MGNTGNLRPWPPGVSGNPRGRPPEIKKPRRFLPRELRETVLSDLKHAAEFLLLSTQADLRRILKAKKAPALEVWLARGILGSMKRGDYMRISRLVDAIVGKPNQIIEYRVICAKCGGTSRTEVPPNATK